MNTGWLLDTSALAVAHEPQVIRWLGPMLRAGLLYTCPVLDIEALTAAHTPEGYRTMAIERLEAYHAVPLSPSVGERALSLQARLRRQAHNRVVDTGDLVVAATAIENDLTLLHYHRGFEVLAELSPLDQRAVAPLGSLT